MQETLNVGYANNYFMVMTYVDLCVDPDGHKRAHGG